MSRRELLKGRRFGRLTVIEDLPSASGTKCCRVMAACDCGTEVTLPAKDVRSGNSTSCGCLRDEMRGSSTRTHGKSGTSTYSSWLEMRSRCQNEGDPVYPYYGGRGIAVCSRWLDFAAFLADMGERPDGMTLDRFPNNDGDYEPKNCRWATSAEQARNRRSNIYATLNGETKCLLDWCQELNVQYDRTRWLIRAKGMTPECAVLFPARASSTRTGNTSRPLEQTSM